MSTAGPAGAAAAPAAAAGDTGTPTEGTPRDGAAGAGQNGLQPIANQSIAPVDPGIKRGANSQTPPIENTGAAPRQRPDWAPEKFWDGNSGTVKLKDLATSYGEATRKLSMRTDDLQKAMDADRRSRLPKTAGEYQFRLSDSYVQAAARNGQQLDPVKAVNVNDPMVRMLASAAHKHGLDQDQVSDLLSHYHFTKMSSRPNPAETIAKLGENGRERIAGVKMFLEGALGPEDTQHLVSYVGGVTPKFIDIMERLMARGGGAPRMVPGAAGLPGQGPTPTRADLKARMMSDAYNNPRHPEYQKVRQEVQAGWERVTGGAQIQTAARDRSR